MKEKNDFSEILEKEEINYQGVSPRHQGKWYVLDKLIKQSRHCIVYSAFCCFNWNIWKQTDFCQGSWGLYKMHLLASCDKGTWVSLATSRNWGYTLYLCQLVRLILRLLLASSWLAILFFFSWAFRLQLIFVSLKEFHNSTCISQLLKLRTFYDAEQNPTIFGKFFSIRYFNSVYLAYAASQNWCEQMQWQWRTMPIFLGKKILKS